MSVAHAIESGQICTGLRVGHDVVDGNRVTDRRHARLFDDCAAAAQHAQRLLEIRAHVAFQLLHRFPNDAEAQPFRTLFDVGGVVVNRLGARGGVERVVPGDDAQELAGFAGRRGEDADLIETRRKRDESPAAYAAVRRFQSDDAAERSGLAY